MYYLGLNNRILCKSGAYASRQTVQEFPERVLVFPNATSASQALKNLHDRRGVTVYSDKTLLEKLDIDNPQELFTSFETTEEQDFETGAEMYAEPAEDKGGPKPGMVAHSNSENTVDTPLILDTIDVLERLSALIERWEATIDNYGKDLASLDARTLDELHFQEFYKLNGAQGYQAYKRLHEIRVERRRVKNEYLVATSARDLFPPGVQNIINDIIRSVDKLKNLQYRPREYWPGEEAESEN